MPTRLLRAFKVILFALLLCALVCGVTAAQAGGSVSLEEVLVILRQNPELLKVVTTSLELNEEGDGASRIGNNVNPNLGGKRVGPYELYARPSKSTGPFIFEVVVTTEKTWLNAAGKPTDLTRAVEVRERLISVEIRPCAPVPVPVKKPEPKKTETKEGELPPLPPPPQKAR